MPYTQSIREELQCRENITKQATKRSSNEPCREESLLLDQFPFLGSF